MKRNLCIISFAILICSALSLFGCTPRASTFTATPTARGTVTAIETGAASPSAVPTGGTPTVAPSTLSIIELKYKLLERFPTFFFCDPDFYPVAREVSDQAIAKRVAELRQNRAEYDAILNHLGLQGVTNPSPAQNRLIDADAKRLKAIVLQPTAQGYNFQLQTSTDNRSGFLISGTISTEGEITVAQQQPIITMCPICLSGSVRIDTPNGAIAVQELRQGMRVWTANSTGQREVAVILQTVRRVVPNGVLLIHLVLADGRELFVSAGHPMFNGQPIGELQIGDILDGARVVSTELRPLEDNATYDILPSGTTKAYWANGVLLKSTLSDMSTDFK